MNMMNMERNIGRQNAPNGFCSIRSLGMESHGESRYFTPSVNDTNGYDCRGNRIEREDSRENRENRENRESRENRHCRDEENRKSDGCRIGGCFCKEPRRDGSLACNTERRCPSTPCKCEKPEQNKPCDEDLLNRIRAIDFSLYEVALYLDAYPCDTRALELYHRLMEQRCPLVARYETEVGPLTFLGNRSRCTWDWIDKPFPWEWDANR